MIISIGEYDRALELAFEALKNGELIIYPTDTLYGIGADATSERAVAKVRKAKGRDDKKPISMVCSGLDMIERYCIVSESNREWMMDMLPGPFTVILPTKMDLSKSLVSGKTVGVRVPKYFFLLDLARLCDFPITSTSANIAGEADPCSLADVPEKVKKCAEVVIDGGACFYSAPSTVVDMTGKEPKILRKGAGEMPAKKGEFDATFF
jgi:L-threonylcarbamoyladenylate synthase